MITTFITIHLEHILLIVAESLQIVGYQHQEKSNHLKSDAVRQHARLYQGRIRKQTRRSRSGWAEKIEFSTDLRLLMLHVHVTNSIQSLV
jgi:hypothetical protein